MQVRACEPSRCASIDLSGLDRRDILQVVDRRMQHIRLATYVGHSQLLRMPCLHSRRVSPPLFRVRTYESICCMAEQASESCFHRDGGGCFFFFFFFLGLPRARVQTAGSSARSRPGSWTPHNWGLIRFTSYGGS